MHYSPLRYPGGKTSLSKFIEDLVKESSLEGSTYYELYAGGAGAGLKLLFNGTFNRIVLNDADVHIYAFWKSILEFNEEFIDRLEKCSIDLDTWYREKEIYKNPSDFEIIDVGFSAFYLNRCNRSGILHKAGPIGGLKQEGKYKIDARFNKETLKKRIKKIGEWKDKITIHNEEASTLLVEIFNREPEEEIFVFLDPPYYKQGENLYLNFYEHNDHSTLANILKQNRDQNWFVSYDNQKEIINLYSDLRMSTYSTRYSLQDKKKASEILIFSDSLMIPDTFRIHSNELEFETFRN